MELRCRELLDFELDDDLWLFEGGLLLFMAASSRTEMLTDLLLFDEADDLLAFVLPSLLPETAAVETLILASTSLSTSCFCFPAD